MQYHRSILTVVVILFASLFCLGAPATSPTTQLLEENDEAKSLADSLLERAKKRDIASAKRFILPRAKHPSPLDEVTDDANSIADDLNSGMTVETQKSMTAGDFAAVPYKQRKANRKDRMRAFLLYRTNDGWKVVLHDPSQYAFTDAQIATTEELLKKVKEAR